MPTSREAAIALQERLAARVVRTDALGAVRHVCGVAVLIDVEERMVRAAAAVLGFPDLALEDRAVVRMPLRHAYEPGLRTVAELPAIQAALARLSVAPDLLLCDAHGIAHPRRFGLASHIGVLADIPSIGVARTPLVGDHDVPPDRRGAWVPLVDRGELIGAVLRTRTGVQPVYVSIGHRVSLDTAIRYVMACATRYRLPETTRWARRLARA